LPSKSFLGQISNRKKFFGQKKHLFAKSINSTQKNRLDNSGGDIANGHDKENLMRGKEADKIVESAKNAGKVSSTQEWGFFVGEKGSTL
jgi:hypothetical protein